MRDEERPRRRPTTRIAKIPNSGKLVFYTPIIKEAYELNRGRTARFGSGRGRWLSFPDRVRLE
ncbi:MAG: hypothetical protein ACE5LF_09270, partial [Alphaproteobacteria bacterium]